MGDGSESLVSVPHFNRPVKDLVYKHLLTKTFTQTSHDRGIKTWCVSVSKPTTGKERTVTVCKESLPVSMRTTRLPTSCGPQRNRSLEV